MIDKWKDDSERLWCRIDRVDGSKSVEQKSGTVMVSGDADG